MRHHTNTEPPTTEPAGVVRFPTPGTLDGLLDALALLGALARVQQQPLDVVLANLDSLVVTVREQLVDDAAVEAAAWAGHEAATAPETVDTDPTPAGGTNVAHSGARPALRVVPRSTQLDEVVTFVETAVRRVYDAPSPDAWDMLRRLFGLVEPLRGALVELPSLPGVDTLVRVYRSGAHLFVTWHDVDDLAAQPSVERLDDFPGMADAWNLCDKLTQAAADARETVDAGR